jgi:hypothetical protein
MHKKMSSKDIQTELDASLLEGGGQGKFTVKQLNINVFI